EAHRETRHRVVVLVGVPLLAIGEEASGQRRPPGEREPEALDLHQVGAEAPDPERWIDVAHLRADAHCQRSAWTFTGTVSRSTTSNVARRESSNVGVVSVTASRSAP